MQPADGDDEMQDTLAMGWRITEVEPHSCQLVQAQQQEGGGLRVNTKRFRTFNERTRQKQNEWTW